MTAMTKNTKRRFGLYGIGGLLLAGLLYGGFVYKADADVPTLVNSAELLAKVGSFDMAIANASKAVEHEPKNRYAHIILAYCYGQKRQFDKALAEYDTAVRLTRPDAKTFGLLRLYHASMLVKAGRAQDGEREAVAVLKRHPRELQAYKVIAQARQVEGRMGAAAAAFTEMHSKAPKAAEPLVLLARLEARRGRFKSARSAIDQAVELAPKSPSVGLLRARILVKVGAREKAVREILAVAKLPRNRAVAYLKSRAAPDYLRKDPRVRPLLARTNGKRSSTKEPGNSGK